MRSYASENPSVLVSEFLDRVIAVFYAGTKFEAFCLDHEMVGDGDNSLEMLPLMVVLDLQLDLAIEISRKVGNEYPVTEL